MKTIVICPGSRSAPLACAASFLAKKNALEVQTCIDERSAGFFALGVSAASSTPTAVITTSGTAVANLLPAAVEADRSCHPIFFISADRPGRLKDCGANQTVNQEEFLRPVSRYVFNTPLEGLHKINQQQFITLLSELWLQVTKFPGPVHLNIPFEEPIHPSLNEQEDVFRGWHPEDFEIIQLQEKDSLPKIYPSLNKIPLFDDFNKEGIIIVGPWRGDENRLGSYKTSLDLFQKMCDWPIFADPLSGIDSSQRGLIGYWDLMIDDRFCHKYKSLQILRLGPMPASRGLERWLASINSNQILISEGDSRNLDPLKVSSQFNAGFEYWYNQLIFSGNSFKPIELKLIGELLEKDRSIDNLLDKELKLNGNINEPTLARFLSDVIPTSIPIMLSASSPIRDWITFAGMKTLSRRIFGFRGASGIDGTLSMGMGLSNYLGKIILVTGDLSLMHDSNGWLFARDKKIKLIVLLIDNFGGGIFHQLPLKLGKNSDFEKYFTMPQLFDPLTLASSFGISYRQVSCFEDLEFAIEWGLSSSNTVLIRVVTDSLSDSALRTHLRDSAHYLLDKRS
tara:strand:+ start:2065 stop:3765 length:1701 start_codon:yes stop_codon:yes gene_type:complete